MTGVTIALAMMMRAKPLSAAFVVALLPALAIAACSSEGGAGDGSPALPDGATADAPTTTGGDGATDDGSVEDADAPLDGATADAGHDADADAATDAAADADAAPEPPSVRYIGRFDTTDPAAPRVAWPGARVLLRFSGTAATATIEETSQYTGPSRYDVSVDGQAPTLLAPANGTGTYDLATGLANGTHTIEIHRRTESLVGFSKLTGFAFPGGGQLLPPPPRAQRRIEFLGDSSSNGYGVECASPATGFSGATENERRSYPYLAAKALSAEHHNLSFAGKGVLRNYDATDAETYPLLYVRTMPEEAGSTWDFSTWAPDVVWISLGGNDWDNPPENPRPPSDLAQFKAKYHELVALVRQKHPQAQIVCSVATSLNDDYPAGYDAYTNMKTVLTEVVNERKAAPTNDTKVHYFELPRANAMAPYADLNGCEGHPTAAWHQTLADAVVAKIKDVTGWP